ncbi:hypothetical protein ACU9SG_002747 [Serratia marcescens]|uniref:hypothetical protein n=1 Tax=Serratia marcescens TaxID=615 RepID=UPI00074525FE|nr:hypothetical protein [Serratia marcescens]EME1466547.1 hypothetical protein [Serratia marcescens]TWY30497.1 hypothetical protein FR965_10700 [Serratia marcescens]CVA07060.1 Uncharacterised protein [Serratia marcescens]CVD61073.1 Uncharacterised protein [Serratia marcescens]CVG71004.1 Uncharacterised protein [Serratia marcescens]
MKIDYQDHGATASITLTSTVFELRRHNRVVDTALFLTSISAHRSGLFFMKTVLSGRSAAVLKAYKVVLREMAR